MNYYKFKTPEKFYLYDVHTNHILRMEQSLWQHIGSRVNKSIHIEDDVDEELLVKIRDLQNNYGILPKKPPPSEIQNPICDDHMIDHLSSKLQYLTLNVTEQCNFRCVYCAYGDCYQSKRKHSTIHMSWRVAKKAVDFFLERSIQARDISVGFYGGEPLIVYNLIRRTVKYIQSRTSRDISYHLTTNGSLLTEKIIKFLIEHKFTINISLDGPEHIHDRYRLTVGQHPTYEKIIENIKLIQSIDMIYYRKKVGFLPTMAPPYDLFAIVNYFADEEIFTNGTLRFSLVNEYDTTFYSRFNMKQMSRIYSKQIVILKKKYISFFRNPPDNTSDQRMFTVLTKFFSGSYIRLHHRPLLPLSGTCYPNGICIPGMRKIFITINGDICMCEKLENAWVIGNIYDGFNIQNISELINRYVKICSSQRCEKCWARRICDLCFTSMFNGNQVSPERKHSDCVIKKRSLASYIREYCYIMEKNPEAFKGTKISG
ncbi:MAG: radical SAM protein [Ignavibacteriales bacterium]|nr:radical SAM protein [Ignavibacteriales bacterium]